MIVFRICKKEYSQTLQASGYAGRWNTKETFGIYTAESRSLACLENLVHRSGEGNNAIYKVMQINIPDAIKIEAIDPKNLNKNWTKIDNIYKTQLMGSNWLKSLTTVILKIPSSIIKNEFNYLLNPNHPDFKKIKIQSVDDFEFDSKMLLFF
jgi:RES domain-containing protein